MIEINDIEQGTPEWLDLKKGLPSPSNYHRIITPKGALSESAHGYMQELIVQNHSPEEKKEIDSKWLARGKVLEPVARDYYEFKTNRKVREVGLILPESKIETCGSVDGLVGKQGVLEIKCKKGENHLAVLDAQEMPDIHIPQVQGYLFLTGRKWCDFLAYHPRFKPFLQRIYRDEFFIEALENALKLFNAQMKLLEKQYLRAA